MAEIWADKSSRFILTGPFDENMPDHYIVIQDYRWWADNEKEIYAWMRACLPKGTEHHAGMVVIIKDESDVVNFMLRWA